MKTNKKGISLIVLVITIVVMIILATAIILSLTSSDIVDSAKEATSANDIASAKQLVRVAEAEWRMEPEGTLDEYINNKLLEAGFKLSGDGAIKVSKSGAVNTLHVDEDGKQAIIPEGFVVSQAKGENTIENGLVIYEGTEPVTDKNVVEARLTRNQFVWVPYLEDTEYTYEGELILDYAAENKTYSELDSEENAEMDEMGESVEKYGGFYIGRYETGTNVKRTNDPTPVSDVLVQKNKEVYNFVSWGRTATQAGNVGAAALARSLYDTESVKSTLCYGVQWNLALIFIEMFGAKDTTYAENSVDKGNYNNETRIKTGSNEAYKLNNIYDMAGNVWEWTMAYRESGKRILRGGCYINTPDADHSAYGANVATVTEYANDEYTLPTDDDYVNYGFRISLYLK